MNYQNSASNCCSGGKVFNDYASPAANKVNNNTSPCYVLYHIKKGDDLTCKYENTNYKNCKLVTYYIYRRGSYVDLGDTAYYPTTLFIQTGGDFINGNNRLSWYDPYGSGVSRWVLSGMGNFEGAGCELTIECEYA